MKFKNFTKQYPVSKTLRFELKPINETAEHMTKILEEDEHRAESYKKVKQLIDEYHKKFIENVLEKTILPTDLLKEYENRYSKDKRNEEDKKKLRSTQEELRKHIVKCFTKEETFKRLFGKELIKNDMPDFVETEEDRKVLEEFKDFTTYFTGFNENRANMYSEEEKHTAIAYRLINENLPKFLDNIKAFNKIVEVPEVKEQIDSIYQEFKNECKTKNISAIFEIDYFNETITQKQIDFYNAVIGGRTIDSQKQKPKGINEYVNLYNQKHKNARLPKLKVLYKQILSERESLSFSIEAYKNDNEVLTDIKHLYETLSENVLGERNLKVLLESIKDYNPEGVFLRNDSQLTEISQRMFGNWNAIQNAVIKQMKNYIPRKRKYDDEEYQGHLMKEYAKRESFSIQELNFCISESDILPENRMRVEDYFGTLAAVNTETEQKENIFSRISNSYTDIKTLLQDSYPDNDNLANDKKNVTLIKNFLDRLKELQWFVKPLLGKGDEADKDNRFYGDFLPLWNELDKLTPLYNKVRNYLTKKPYSQEKFKLNFENSTLMNGWDQSKERDNSTVILRKDGLYYLGIMNKRYNKVFDADKLPKKGECYQKMVYKLLPGANKMLPKVFFSKSRIDEFKPSREILDIKENGRYKGENFNLKDCHALIDFYKTSISKHPDWKEFGFKFSETKSYGNINQFFNEIEQQGYKISFQDVSVEYVNRLVKEGKIYLFQIYNKDFSSYSKGTPNMHTLYWKMLFDKENLQDVVYKLSGEAEVFYRKKSLRHDHPTHPANMAIDNKNKSNPKPKSTFPYDLVKDKRYTIDKFMLHVPIVMNFKNKGKENIDALVREYLKSAPDTHIIGIDRGERHLLYLVVIDNKGHIVEQSSMNIIESEYKKDGVTYTPKVDYHQLLDDKEGARKKSRQSWQTIENIKNLKEGYLSQVVHKITGLMVKYDAIVVLEDLNLGFMRGRQKVEKQVYQKFEQMLIDKLNYLVDKKAELSEAGGLLNAYQLTSKFESFQKLQQRKQSGFLFYVPAWNTSKIDPVTGFVNLFDTRYKNMEEAKSFFGKFDGIRYNEKANRFEFQFDYENFTDRATDTRTQWTLCAQGKRVKTMRDPENNNQWKSQEIELEPAFKTLFNDYEIDIHDNLKESIVTQTDADFFKRLLNLLRLTLQMRNSITGKETDYLVSPVCDKNGKFFDSTQCGKELPQNADANGAYNIARKGLMLLHQLKESEDMESSKPTYDLSNKSWLQFAQQ